MNRNWEDEADVDAEENECFEEFLNHLITPLTAPLDSDAEAAARESETPDEKKRREADPSDLFSFEVESLVVPFMDAKRLQIISAYLKQGIRVYSRTSKPKDPVEVARTTEQEEYIRSELSIIAITFDGGNPQTTAMIQSSGQATALTRNV